MYIARACVCGTYIKTVTRGKKKSHEADLRKSQKTRNAGVKVKKWKHVNQIPVGRKEKAGPTEKYTNTTARTSIKQKAETLRRRSRRSRMFVCKKS